MTTSEHAGNQPVQAAGSEAILTAVHLQKRFALQQANPFRKKRAVHAVDDGSLALYPRRATAIVGESGSGKTTVARMLARLYGPTSGEIFFRGQPVSRLSMSEYRRHVQMVFQDPFSSLNPVHDVRYLLARPLQIFGHAKSQTQATEQVLSLLERVSLTPAAQFAEKYPHELSGGQRQRVAIARALAVRPSVLLADEPVSMLDVSIRLDILNLLLTLKEEEDLALLYITHDIASARYFAEETLVMYAGQMVEGGASETVIQAPKHPYTQLLLSAAPDPDRRKRNSKGFSTLPARGEIPSLVTPPSGCRFHPRCPHAMPVCRERFPGRTEFAGNRWVNCWLYGEGSNGASPTVPTVPTVATSTTPDANT
ncbi:MAG TPA: ABC transporter ATP-binding protein [Ktedonobacterales bacterium]|jgi:peptide/nickel transport system ATP-binding protein|nr:ABC transporter ATP-binding protein [Ktedonobacterales bacterium]